MKGLVILLLFIAFTVQAQKPKPCALPRVCETKLVQFIPQKNTSVLAKLSYDADRQRIRVAEEVNVATKKTFFDVISIYEKKIMYVVQITVSAGSNVTRTCTKYPLTEPFKESAIPADATFVNQVYIGTGAEPGAGLLVNVFVGKVQTQGKTASYMVTVTDNLCLPVSEQVEMPGIGHMQQSFFDVVLGIEDPGRFVPPPECRKARLRQLHPKMARRLPKAFAV